jgi:Tfp pilus assembly protein PilZ
VGILCARNESGEQWRRRIEELIGGALKSSRPTHTV